MFTLIALVLFGFVGSRLLAKYESHLDAQLGPWVLAEARVRPQRRHRHIAR